MTSEWHSSMSENVPFTSGASSIARCTSGRFVALLYATSLSTPCTPRRERRLVRVQERHRNAALHVRRRDALPHHARADNAGRRDLLRPDRRRHARILLVPIAQEEDVQKRPIDRRAEQLRKFLGLHLAGSFQINAGRAEHQFQRR